MIGKGIWNTMQSHTPRVKGDISQEEIVCNELSTNGEISRNWAIENGIMHVAATVDKIRKDKGLKITSAKRGNDCVYTLIKTLQAVN